MYSIRCFMDCLSYGKNGFSSQGQVQWNYILKILHIEKGMNESYLSLMKIIGVFRMLPK